MSRLSTSCPTTCGAAEGSALGHEDQFLPPKMSARSVIRKQTVAATRGNGRDAPTAVVS
jgi:hypothetical protein